MGEGCARIHARDFTRIDTLTIASVLPGVADNYPDPGRSTECDTPQLGTNYVRSWARIYVKNPCLPPIPRNPPPGENP
jgi:hypothetical protein